MKLRGVSHPDSGKTAPRKATESLVWVLKPFCHENSVLDFSDSRTWRRFTFLTRIAVLLRCLTALCTDEV